MSRAALRVVQTPSNGSIVAAVHQYDGFTSKSGNKSGHSNPCFSLHDGGPSKYAAEIEQRREEARARARKWLADKQAAAVPIGRNNKGQPIYRRQRTGFVVNPLPEEYWSSGQRGRALLEDEGIAGAGDAEGGYDDGPDSAEPSKWTGSVESSTNRDPNA